MSPKLPVLTTVGLSVLLLSGCRRVPVEPESAGLPPLESMNVLLIVVDTLGAEHVGTYGVEDSPTPHIDRLAREGVVFERAFSPAPWTVPAVASLFTSLTPSDHGVTQLSHRIPNEIPLLAEEMKARGFSTAGVISHVLIKEKGFQRGFDIYDRSSVSGHGGICGEKVTDRAISLLTKMADEPFFLFVHYFDPHYNYIHHPRFDRTSGYDGRLEPNTGIWKLRDMRQELDSADIDYLVGLYREEVAFTDDQIGRLLSSLADLGLSEDTLVILTADHGEELMRHGWIGHTRTLYDELLHVPLIVHLPTRLHPHRVDAPVSLLDIMPTLMDLSLESPSPSPWQGMSLVDLLTGASAGRMDRELVGEVAFIPIHAAELEASREKRAFKTAIRFRGWKLIHDLEAGTWELYDLEQDPYELNNLWRVDHPYYIPLRGKLAAWEKDRVETWNASAPAEGLDPETIRELRALGYMR